MYKHILVSATGFAADRAVFQTALLAATPFGAHIEFLHARLDVTEVIVAMSSGGVGGGDAVQSVVDRLDTDAKAQEQKAWAGFTAFCAAAKLPTSGGAPGSGLCADMVVETGNEGQWLAEYGRFADLVVVGRKREGEEVAMDVLEAALMDTGRPLLIAPETPPTSLLGVVVIAWKDTIEAARAVAAAMPLIDRAERVIILTVGESDDADESGARLQRALRWHSAETTLQVLPRAGRDPVDVLLDAANNLGATLLVMGGYSHSQLREAVFGGFTRRVLNGADLPVLMAH